MAEAPSGHDILSPDDAINIFEELLEAQNQSRFLGLRLNVPEHVVEAIHTKYTDSKDRLYYVLVEYLQQIDPTWRAIVAALRSPAVNLPQLAKKVEAAHFPDRTSIRPEPRKVIQPAPKNDNSISSQTISSDDTGTGEDTSTAAGTQVKPSGLPNQDQIPVDRQLVPYQQKGTASEVQKPNLINLQVFPLQIEGSRNIIARAAVQYRCIGTILLNDKDGSLVAGLTTSQQPIEIMRNIFEKWIRLDTECSWPKLTECMRQCELGVLAQEIEYALQLHPQHSQAGTGEDTSTVPGPQVKPSGLPYQDPMTVEYVQDEIRKFERRFNALKNATRECLERLGIPVKRVADALTSLPADDVDEHKLFLKENMSALFQAPDHSEQFGTMNLHWNYQNYQLLDHLISEFDLEGVKGEMKSYKADLQQFRKKTSLKVFCNSQKNKGIKLPPDFCEMVAKFNWPDNVTLEDVEEFRQAYAGHYSLRECAMMLAQVVLGSFCITWFIPASIVKKLKVKVPAMILKNSAVIKLEVDGECIYSSDKCSSEPTGSIMPTAERVHVGTSTQSSTPDHPSSAKGISHTISISEQDYDFVEQLPQDFYCPVTYELLLQPHLTACCGKHLSEKAATMIKEVGGPCAMCKATNLSTILDKHFRRQLYERRVFCHNKKRGCGWQGELSDYVKHHIELCPMKNAPLPPMYEETSETALDTPTPKLTLECRRMREALHSMYRGSATSDDKYAFFTSSGSTSIHRYEWSTEFWLRLPSSPYRDTGLVIIDGELTTVGGRDNFLCTNRLLTLRQNQWVEEYPHMVHPHSQAAVASTSNGNYIAVIGGHVGGDWSTTVELFKVQSREWYELTNLPQPLRYPSATICGNRLYAIGKGRDGYSCSIEPQTSTDQQMQSNSETWTRLPPLPVTYSTIATLSRQPVIVCGWRRVSSVNSIYQLVDENWVKIGSISNDRRRCLGPTSNDRRMCLVANASPERMLIVGGERGITFGGYKVKNVDECVVIQ